MAAYQQNIKIYSNHEEQHLQKLIAHWLIGLDFFHLKYWKVHGNHQKNFIHYPILISTPEPAIRPVWIPFQIFTMSTVPLCPSCRVTSDWRGSNSSWELCHFAAWTGHQVTKSSIAQLQIPKNFCMFHWQNFGTWTGNWSITGSSKHKKQCSGTSMQMFMNFAWTILENQMGIWWTILYISCLEDQRNQEICVSLILKALD